MTSNAIAEKVISNQLSSELCKNCATPLHCHDIGTNEQGVAVAKGRVGGKWVDCSRQVKEAIAQQSIQQLSLPSSILNGSSDANLSRLTNYLNNVEAKRGEARGARS